MNIVTKRNIILLTGESIMLKVELNKQQDKLEVYDNDGIYWYSISEDDMIQDAGLSVKEAKQIMDSHKPKSGDSDHCYGCGTHRHPCIDEVIL